MEADASTDASADVFTVRYPAIERARAAALARAKSQADANGASGAPVSHVPIPRRPVSPPSPPLPPPPGGAAPAFHGFEHGGHEPEPLLYASRSMDLPSLEGLAVDPLLLSKLEAASEDTHAWCETTRVDAGACTFKHATASGHQLLQHCQRPPTLSTPPPPSAPPG